MSFVIVAGGGSVGLVMAVPALAVPLATASAVVGAAWPVATWMQKRSMSGGEVRDE
jgi:predicted PurR-regulated permease PerM